MHEAAKSRHTIAIVGGGALGAALTHALVEKLSSETLLRNKAHIVLFEKSEAIGRGLAYAKDPSPYLLNQSAQTMSIVPSHRAHFAEWLGARGLVDVGVDEVFCTREIFGDYVESCFANALEVARQRGIAVTTVRDEVVAISPRLAPRTRTRLDGHRIETTAHAPVDAHDVVLALGNLRGTRFPSLRGTPGFLGSPYPSTALRRIPPRARVAVLGTGLTAIDAVLALFANGHEAPVTMASRSGLLPSVRGPLHARALRYVTPENVAAHRPLRWSTVLRWLELESRSAGTAVDWDRDFPAWVDPLRHYSSQVAAAESGERPWQSIGEALNPMIEVVWHHLADDDKRVFLNHYYSRFMSHWVPIPLRTGRRVLDALRVERLRVARGLGDVRFDGGKKAFRIELGEKSAEFDFVVDATGAPRALADCDSTLLRSLAAHGTIAAHAHGGLRVEFDSLRVIGRDGRTAPHLFAIGNLTSGTHLFTSTLEFNVHKAERLAAHLISELQRRSEKAPHVDVTPHST